VTTDGVDYAWKHPSPAALKAAGIGFACRYLATDTSKALSKAEATALATAGIWSVVVWETTAKRMLAGKLGGVADAKAAAIQAASCGMPASRPIYFAADWDATLGQQTAINAYLDGAASVLGRARVGIYGGYYPVKRALDAGKAAWAWQTRAWSGGQWDQRAHIRQGAYVTIGGVQCDANTAMKSDVGQWMPGLIPEEDTVADLTLRTEVPVPDWVASKWPAPKGDDPHTILLQTALASGYGHARRAADAAEQASAQLTALTKQVADLKELVGQLQAGREIDYAKLAAALITAVVTKGA
jgi:hypothetical protein